MNTVTRVAIIVNFVLALGFALTSFILYAKQVNWAQTASRLVNRTNEVTQEYTQFKATVEQQAAKINAELGELRTTNAALKTDNGNLRNENTRLGQQINDNKSTIAAMTTRANVDAANLEKSNAEVTRLKKEGDDLRGQMRVSSEKESRARLIAMEAAANVQQQQEQIQRQAAQIHELALQVEELSGVVALAEQAMPDLQLRSGAGVVTAADIAGSIISVDPASNLVVVNVGERHGVRAGMELTVARGANYLGKIRISTVKNDMSAGRILDVTPDPKAIQVSDTVLSL